MAILQISFILESRLSCRWLKHILLTGLIHNHRLLLRGVKCLQWILIQVLGLENVLNLREGFLLARVGFLQTFEQDVLALFEFARLTVLIRDLFNFVFDEWSFLKTYLVHLLGVDALVERFQTALHLLYFWLLTLLRAQNLRVLLLSLFQLLSYFAFDHLGFTSLLLCDFKLAFANSI